MNSTLGILMLSVAVICAFGRKNNKIVLNKQALIPLAFAVFAFCSCERVEDQIEKASIETAASAERDTTYRADRNLMYYLMGPERPKESKGENFVRLYKVADIAIKAVQQLEQSAFTDEVIGHLTSLRYTYKWGAETYYPNIKLK